MLREIGRFLDWFRLQHLHVIPVAPALRFHRWLALIRKDKHNALSSRILQQDAHHPGQ